MIQSRQCGRPGQLPMPRNRFEQRASSCSCPLHPRCGGIMQSQSRRVPMPVSLTCRPEGVIGHRQHRAHRAHRAHRGSVNRTPTGMTNKSVERKNVEVLISSRQPQQRSRFGTDLLANHATLISALTGMPEPLRPTAPWSLRGDEGDDPPGKLLNPLSLLGRACRCGTVRTR